MLTFISANAIHSQPSSLYSLFTVAHLNTCYCRVFFRYVTGIYRTQSQFSYFFVFFSSHRKSISQDLVLMKLQRTTLQAILTFGGYLISAIQKEFKYNCVFQVFHTKLCEYFFQINSPLNVEVTFWMFVNNIYEVSILVLEEGEFLSYVVYCLKEQRPLNASSIS